MATAVRTVRTKLIGMPIGQLPLPGAVVPPDRQDHRRDGDDDHCDREPSGDQVDVDGKSSHEFRLPKITTAVPSELGSADGADPRKMGVHRDRSGRVASESEARTLDALSAERRKKREILAEQGIDPYPVPLRPDGHRRRAAATATAIWPPTSAPARSSAWPGG